MIITLGLKQTILLFTEESWEDYQYWQQTDKKILKKINQLINAIKRDPFDAFTLVVGQFV